MLVVEARGIEPRRSASKASGFSGMEARAATHPS